MARKTTKGGPKLRFLGYGFPRREHDDHIRTFDHEQFELTDAPLRAEVSFLDFDGVVVCAGAFARMRGSARGQTYESISDPELDQRDREALSAVKRGLPIMMFLVPATYIESHFIGLPSDLFHRVAIRSGFDVASAGRSAAVDCLVPEFKEYIERFGTGYVKLTPKAGFQEYFAPICTEGSVVFGAAIGNRVFVLPSVSIDRIDQSVDIVACAIKAMLAYRERVSRAMPRWLEEFSFLKERELKFQAQAARAQLEDLEARAGSYASFKGVLCFQSDPLVKAVCDLFSCFFGINLQVDERFIEDATIVDASGNVEAVVEIKGVNTSFKRGHVAQVDAHRDRLGLPPTIPGLLIVNTMHGASSLLEKDVAVHPDIIAKAISDNVLLVRTLDLIRYADAIDRGLLSQEVFRQTILGSTGWLRVDENGIAEVIVE